MLPSLLATTLGYVAAFLAFCLQYLAYLLEIALIVYMLQRGHWRKWPFVCVLLASYFAADWGVRPYALGHYGLLSLQYYYTYWLTDIILTVEAFGLICTFFRKAQGRHWPKVRGLLAAAFVGVVAISILSLHDRYRVANFLPAFQQNLYFACLLLDTALYAKLPPEDHDELGLFVSGLGIQFAGPSACLAYAYLTQGHHNQYVLTWVTQVCTSGMLLTWLYAVARKPLSGHLGACKCVA